MLFYLFFSHAVVCFSSLARYVLAFVSRVTERKHYKQKIQRNDINKSENVCFFFFSFFFTFYVSQFQEPWFHFFVTGFYRANIDRYEPLIVAELYLH